MRRSISSTKNSPATWTALIWQISGWVTHHFFHVMSVDRRNAASNTRSCRSSHSEWAGEKQNAWKLQATFSINKCISIATRRTSDFVAQNYLGFLFALPQNSIVHEERYPRCLHQLQVSVVTFTSTLEALQTSRPSRSTVVFIFHLMLDVQSWEGMVCNY